MFSEGQVLGLSRRGPCRDSALSGPALTKFVTSLLTATKIQSRTLTIPLAQDRTHSGPLHRLAPCPDEGFGNLGRLRHRFRR